MHDCVKDKLLALVRKKDEIIFRVLGIDVIANNPARTMQMIDPELLRQLHFEVFPGQETLFLNDKKLVTFYDPEMESTDNNGVFTMTQKYQVHK